jgi:hypothetical protein
MFTEQFKTLSLKEQASIIKALRALHKENRVTAKIEKAAERQAKAVARSEKREALRVKREAAIVKAQARLQKLLEKQAKPVGVKAVKAAKRPSKVVILKGQEAANAVA